MSGKIKLFVYRKRLIIWLFVKLLSLIFYGKERKTKELFRMKPELYVNKFFHNPLVVAQVKEQFVFDPDYYLGHKSPSGKEFFGEKKFISFQEIVLESKIKNKNIILNLGDSSTSGWDSRVVEFNRKVKSEQNKIRLPFFQYKTYADFLRDYTDDYIIVNAGIPAFTSYQGARYLSTLLDSFTRENCKVVGVTIYFGNNDCSWNSNKEDKNLMPKNINSIYQKILYAWFENSYYAKLVLADKIRKQGAPGLHESIKTRTSLNDYAQSIEAMIILCKNRGISCCLIEPMVPYHWEPGTREKGSVFPSPYEKSPGGYYVHRFLKDALKNWEIAQLLRLNKRDYENAQLAYESAVEIDFLVPRIKKEYKLALENLANIYEIPLIKIEIPRNEDEEIYILDYCHPYEPANLLIAKCLLQFINNINPNNYIKKYNSARKELSKILPNLEKRKYYNGQPPEDRYPML